MGMGKNNIDKWSIFHGLGTFFLAFVLYKIIHSYTDTIVATIISMTLWELIDALAYQYPKSILAKFFDIRGTSIMDYTIGYIGIGLFLHIFKNNIVIGAFDWDYVVLVAISCTVFMILLNSISYYKESVGFY